MVDSRMLTGRLAREPLRIDRLPSRSLDVTPIQGASWLNDPSLARLTHIRHIVVVKMENRSFDQMLGYLKRDGMPEVNGLRGGEINPDANGKPVPAFEWGADQTVFDPPQDQTGKILDPCHSGECVQEQLADDNGGFVRNFTATRKDRSGKLVRLPPECRRLPMGYYARQHLPTYDFLARNLCVCDSWRSSVPGDTWPNCPFALAGREGPRALPGLLRRLQARFSSQLRLLNEAPIYDVEAFTRQLAADQWRRCSHDPATLRPADGRYRGFGDLDRDNFSFFDRQKVSLNRLARQLPRRLRKRTAARGLLHRSECRRPERARP